MLASQSAATLAVLLAAHVSAAGAQSAPPPGAATPLTGKPCVHRIDMYDSYGDGWNGNTLDVHVNGVLILDDITLPSGFGPESVYFLAAEGDELTTVYNPIGGWPFEPYYQIWDGVPDGPFLIVQDGGDFVQPTGVTVHASCVCECPENSIPENEPCGDDTNGGCDSAAEVFEALVCMQTICGTGWCD